MQTLHVAPGHSAAGSLQQALLEAGRADDVLPCPDNFSCGPIASLAPSERAAWWSSLFDISPDQRDELSRFWQRLDAWSGRLVLWFGRGAAMELAFLHAVVERLADRRVFVVDVTGLRFQYTRRDSTLATSQPAPAMFIIPSESLRALLGTEHELGKTERSKLRADWSILARENAPFRIVGEAGLTSAPEDYFDEALLASATTEWRKLARVVGETLVSERADLQVGDLMLLARAVSLVEQGRLLAKGDPWQMKSCEVRLPDASQVGDG